MSLSRETMLELMAYADGELDGADAARIEALIAKDADARQVVESIFGSIDGPDAFASILRPSFDAAAKSANADGIADAVMTRIAGEAMQPKVASLNAARAKRDARSRIAFVAVGVMAIAASVFFFVRSRNNTASPNDTNVAAVNTAQNPASPTVADEPSEADDAVQVDEVDTPAKDVSVYYVRDPGGDKSLGSVVVWVGTGKPPNTGGK